jgi:hypothetical protein
MVVVINVKNIKSDGGSVRDKKYKKVIMVVAKVKNIKNEW